MKKVISLTIAAALWCSLSFGQDKTASDNAKAKSFIGITGGYSSLTGNITKSDYDNNSSGYAAKSGYNIAVDGAYYFSKYIGVGGVFSHSGFNAANLQSMADGYKDAFDVDSVTLTTSKQYGFTNFFVGPYFSFPVKKFTFDVRLLGGLTHATSPKFKVDLEDQLNATFYQDNASANAFGFQAGIGARYSIIKNLSARLNIDYMYAKPDFKITNENRANNAGRLITEYHEAISMLNVNLGVAYQFGR